MLADSGFHSEANMEKLAEKQIDGDVADRRLGPRDLRVENHEGRQVAFFTGKTTRTQKMIEKMDSEKGRDEGKLRRTGKQNRRKP